MSSTSTVTSTSKRSSGKKEKDLADLFLHGIKDIYYAEKKLTKAIPKLIKAAQSQDLIDALSKHLKETQEHVDKVEEIFGLLNQNPKATRCDAIDGHCGRSEQHPGGFW